MASHTTPVEPKPMPLDAGEDFADVLWRPSPGALRNVIGTLLVGAGIAVAVFMFGPKGAINSQSISVTVAATTDPPKVGKPAPDFELTQIDGTKVRLSDLKGKPVWINFWATWCPPCRAENPDIQEVYNEHKDADGLVLLSPAIGESRDTVAGYMERADLHYPVGTDPTTQIAANYRVLGIPTHVFVDREGIIRDMRVGAMSKKTMEKKIALISESPAP
ncbi:MAG: TlpA family protein disulfide reductase [Dehalococcoidia bacterium]|nr:MAG: TlpA family protein disulfide reductase [Dehalococcoidia bacterium]